MLHRDGKYPGISFVGTDKVLVYETETTGQLSTRGDPEISSEFRLHLSVLDAQAGALELTRDWNTHLHSAQVLATAGGVLVKTGGILRLYSQDFEEARELRISQDPSGNFFVSTSASGRTIAICQYQTRAKGYRYSSHVEVFDADNLKLKFSWDQFPPIFRMSLSDTSFVMTHTGVVNVEKFGGHEGRSLTSQSSHDCGRRATILSDESILLQDCDAIRLISSTGSSHTLESFDDRGSRVLRDPKCKPYNPTITPTSVSVASGGSRFVAVSLPTVETETQLLQESRQCLSAFNLTVYDLALKRQISSINIDPAPEKDFDFALSPDGSRLAVLNDQTVSVYALTAGPL